MPVTPLYPGVYTEETPRRPHTITALPTTVAAFVDVFDRGPIDQPIKVTSVGQFMSVFGAINQRSKASDGIRQFFANGGSVAWVVRIQLTGDTVAIGSTDHISLAASGPGHWGNQIQIATQPAGNDTFDLVVRELSAPLDTTTDVKVINVEEYRSISAFDAAGNSTNIIEKQSLLVTVYAVQPARTTSEDIPEPADSILNPAIYTRVDHEAFRTGQFRGGNSSMDISSASALGSPADLTAGTTATGLYTLADRAPNSFNILCMPVMATFDQKNWLSAYISQGRLNIEIGFAPLKPAEFSIIQITRNTGKS